MTCEDEDERNQETVVEKGGRRISMLVASRPIRRIAQLLPQRLRRAIVTVLLTAADVLRA